MAQEAKQPTYIHEVEKLHSNAIMSFLNSSRCQGKTVNGKNSTTFVSTDLYPQHCSKISVLSTGENIFLVHTEGTCITDELKDENPEFADEEIKVFPPRTIIFDISGVLSVQEISVSIRSHELEHQKIPYSTYSIEVCVSSGNLSQSIQVLINVNQLGAEENGSDGSVRKNIVIEQTGIVPPSVDCDDIVFLAELLDDDTTIDRVEPGEEEEKVVGSILFYPVFDSDLKSTEVD